ncbi:MAG: adenosylmethionine--8-amino-7-oxononanoate transaminase [Deltaproteobacteria bacterium]|nr:adenosylmethionine--8-amino-7-oxononanoate transaminase [Deltaproteobacteria bacterium]
MRTTEQLLELDRRHVWHPFTPQQEWEAEPQLVIRAAEGMSLVDSDGRRYIDGVSSLWVGVFGHRVPELDAAVREQLDRVAHSTLLGLGNEPSIELAAKLASFLPAPLRRVFYSDNGSTSVEVAVKMAYQFCRQNGRERRTKFVAFTDAYHGDTLGSVSLGGIDLFHGAYRPLLFGVHRAAYPHCFRCPLGEAGDPCRCGMRCAREFEQLLERHGHEIAGCVIEPLVQGAAGMATAPQGFLGDVAAACRRHGVLLIVDEVATGVCRTGPFLACKHEDVVPDFVCLAKGLTGGYLPLATTVTTDEIYRGFLGPRHLGRTFFHGHTYTGTPLAAAAAGATLDLVRSRDLPRHVEALGPAFDRFLAPLHDHPLVGDVRRRGVMTGIELVADRDGCEPFDPALRVGHRVAMAARRHGAIVRPIGDVLILNPPPAIDIPTLDALVEAVRRAVADVAEELRPSARGGEARAPRGAGLRSSVEPPRPVSEPPPAERKGGRASPAGARARAPLRTPAEHGPIVLPRRLAVAGTDTGVGKTLAATLVALAFRKAGLRVAVAKPVESGLSEHLEGAADAERLARVADDRRPLSSISPYRFRAAVAPTVAAEAEGVTIDPQVVRACVRDAVGAGDATVVEGAGGLLAPLAPGLTLRSLAAEFDLPLLVVVADRLGCVNHALLTLEAARAAACRVCGFVLCRTTAGEDESRQSNRALLERLTDVPVLFEIPYLRAPEQREDLAALVQRVHVPI